MSERKSPRGPADAGLRAVAVAAPDCVRGAKGQSALNSADPASLFNACRIAAARAAGMTGSWSTSNWAVETRADLRGKYLLMYSLDDLQHFRDLLTRERPNILFIGAMTLCMPGAIACARIAKKMFGEEILVVLGGRHPSETIYLESRRIRSGDNVTHHRASPVRQIRVGQVPPVFDVVVSGEGEYAIAELGELVARYGADCVASKMTSAFDRTTPGDWIISIPSEGCDIVGETPAMERNSLPGLAPLFGVSASFDVFHGRMTAHLFSDTGRGCVYDCMFCSERSSITGGLRDIRSAPDRLHRRMAEAVAVIEEDNPGRGASAFVEDSVLLGGSPKTLDRFCDLLEEDPLDIVFGAQFTIDQIIGREAQIARLACNGMSYLFIGLETFDPDEIGGMSKDLGHKTSTWEQRFRTVLDICDRYGISIGCALLFGLGESHASRIALLDMLIETRKARGTPVVVSANWAVQHPLKGADEGMDYDYLEWGTPAGPFLDYFHHFGEASTKYPMAGVALPSLDDLEEIVDRMRIFEVMIAKDPDMSPPDGGDPNHRDTHVGHVR